MIIASIFAYEMLIVARTGQAFKKQIDFEDVREFNAKFEKYYLTDLRAHEVVTLMGYIDEYNLQNEDGITITTNALSSTELYKYIKKQDNMNDSTFLNAILSKEISLSEESGEEKNIYFRCSIKYGQDGRVNEIDFRYK